MMYDAAFIYDKITTEDVVFTRADEALRKLTWRLNGEVFAPPVELDAYVDHQTKLSQHALCRNGRCTYFVLAHKDDGTHIVASCESIKKTVFIAGKQTGYNHGFVEATGFAIASVYTNPKYRRLGMAAYMLRRLQEQMDTESECSALYSDIGKIYYSNQGWDAFPSQQATISLNSKESFRLPPEPRTRYLTLDELPALCERDVSQMRAKFQRLAADHSKTHVAFAPDFDQISWQLTREDLMADSLHAKRSPHRGAITKSGRGWVYWDHDWKTKQLKILRFVLLEVEPTSNEFISEDKKAWEVLELLQAAAAEAAASGLKKVLVWNPDATTTKGIKNFHNLHERGVDVVFDERKDTAIPSFRWKGGLTTKDTTWQDNQYYAWC